MSTDSDVHLTLVTATPLEPAQNYTLIFVFDGIMVNKSNKGMFWYDYTDKDGKNTSLIATSLETIHARRVFPCFDDPFFKAVFDLTVIHPKGSQAHSNTEVEYTKDLDDKRIETKFKPTVKMSVYLWALAVGDFTESVATSKSGVKMRTLGLKIFEGYIDNAAQISAQCLDVMEDLIGVKYPMKKLDHMDTFVLSSGGMENFGLVIYGNLLPLRFPAPLSEDKLRPSIICHETAHMWFGNLVTADRWGLEFLHESFATFFQAAALETIAPYTYLEREYAMTTAEYARLFAKDPSHPLATNMSYFDVVTYMYGGEILRSIKAVLGKETFYKALHIYISENMYKNADLETLLSSFERAAPSKYLCGNLTVTEYMRDYFLQAGSPQVTIKFDEDGRFRMKQTPFQNKTLWNVPIFMKDLNSSEEFIYWMRKNGVHCVANARGYIYSKLPYFFNHNSGSFAVMDTNLAVWERVRRHPSFMDLPFESHSTILYNLIIIGQSATKSEVLYEIVKAKNGSVNPLLLRFLSTRDAHYLQILKIVSDKLNPTSPAWEDRIRGDSIFLGAVYAGVESAVNMAKNLFAAFTKDCARGKEVVWCEPFLPEFRCGTFVQGNKTTEGRQFLLDYFQRIAETPVIASGFAKTPSTCNIL